MPAAPSFEGVTHAAGAGTICNFTSPAITDANYAICTIHWLRGTAPPTGYHCTFDGVECALIGVRQVQQGSNFWGIRMYKHPNPGSQKTVHFSWTQSGGYWVAACRTYKDVGLGDPHGSFASNSGQSTNPAVTVSSAIGELVIDAGVQNAPTATQGAGQTLRLNRHDTSTLGFGSDEAGAPSVAMTWTTGYARGWAIGGVPLRPAAVGGEQVMWLFSKVQRFYRDLRLGRIPPDKLLERYGGLLPI